MCLAQRNRGMNVRPSARGWKGTNDDTKRFNALLSMLLCAAMLLSMVAMLSGCTRSGKMIPLLCSTKSCIITARKTALHISLLTAKT